LDFTQRRMVVSYQRFGTTYRSQDGIDRLSRNVGTKLPFCAA